MLLALGEARSILAPFRDSVLATPLVEAVKTWHRFVSDQPGMALAMDETARANMIHCWWRNGVRRGLSHVSGVREVGALGFFAVAVDTNPLVRFKFLGAGVPSNVSTDQQTLLAFHQYDDEAMKALVLDGVPAPPTLVTCGYRLDAAAQLTCIEIRCDYARKLLWRWPIWGDEAEAQGVVEVLPLPGTPGPRPARVVSTRQPQRQDQQEAP